MAPVEFAPEYSKAERVRFLVLAFAAGALLVAVCQLWFFPWLRDFSAAAQCRSIFGINGTVLLFYGVFVGLPLHAALLIAATAGRRGYRILREGRTPPSGEKVFRPTPIIRGAKARLSGYMQIFCAAPLLALAIWGGFQAHALVTQTEAVPARCAANSSIERASDSGLGSRASDADVKP